MRHVFEIFFVVQNSFLPPHPTKKKQLVNLGEETSHVSTFGTNAFEKCEASMIGAPSENVIRLLSVSFYFCDNTETKKFERRRIQLFCSRNAFFIL